MTDTAGLTPYKKYTLLIGEIEKEVLEAKESARWYAKRMGGVNDRGAMGHGWGLSMTDSNPCSSALLRIDPTYRM